MTDPFTLAAGGWKLGWSFNCAQLGGSGTFALRAQRSSGDAVAEDPPVIREGAEGNGVEEYPSEGEHVLVIETECLWALKVTGSPG